MVGMFAFIVLTLIAIVLMTKTTIKSYGILH